MEIPAIKIPYLRNTNTGDLTRTVAESQQDGGVKLSAPVGINLDREKWEIQTVPDFPQTTLELQVLLESNYGKPFIWLNKPTGADGKYYWVFPKEIRWSPKKALASIEFTVERYYGAELE